MFKKLGIAAAILAVTGMAFSAFAPAVSAEGGPGNNAVLHGRGVLDAQGSGLVALKGVLDMHATARAGILLVKDEGGDAVVSVDGDGSTTMWRGFKVYFGLDGEANVTGSRVAVIVVGKDIDLHAAGKGWAYLKGNGRYTVNGHGPFPWTEDGAFASIAEPPAP